ncbi:MAG: hypothetical protein ACTSUR_02220 [Candidatus Heimdallarchaeaceae archaeon]
MMCKEESHTIDEMKNYIKVILKGDDFGLGFFLGSRLELYGLMEKKVKELKIKEEEKVTCYLLGRLGAIIEFLLAYLNIKNEKTSMQKLEVSRCDSLIQLKTSSYVS